MFARVPSRDKIIEGHTFKPLPVLEGDAYKANVEEFAIIVRRPAMGLWKVCILHQSGAKRILPKEYESLPRAGMDGLKALPECREG